MLQLTFLVFDILQGHPYWEVGGVLRVLLGFCIWVDTIVFDWPIRAAFCGSFPVANWSFRVLLYCCFAINLCASVSCSICRAIPFKTSTACSLNGFSTSRSKLDAPNRERPRAAREGRAERKARVILLIALCVRGVPHMGVYSAPADVVLSACKHQAKLPRRVISTA